MKKINVLLTDGNYQNTNAIIRSLKSKNLMVGVICNSFLDLNYISLLPDKKFLFNTNLLKNSDEEAFQKYWDELENVFTRYDIEVFMPVGNISFRFTTLFKNKIEKYTKVLVANIDKMNIAQNKNLTFKFAQKIGIPIPKTYWLEENSDVDFISKNIRYPCVIKRTNFNEGGVIYCNDQEELTNNLKKILIFTKDSYRYPIIQEYINGTGTGYYSIYKDGVCYGYFMHERIHEFPITGGASTLAKSVFKEDLKNYGDKILKELNWTGVAMVEFKRANIDGSLKLMEINPKFWGSYELSFTSGINFAYLYYLIAKGVKNTNSSYEKDIHFRWVLPGDLLWFLFSSKTERKKFRKFAKKVNFRTNIHWNDPFTVLHHLANFLLKLFKAKKYPHGFIKQKN